MWKSTLPFGSINPLLLFFLELLQLFPMIFTSAKDFRSIHEKSISSYSSNFPKTYGQQSVLTNKSRIKRSIVDYCANDTEVIDHILYDTTVHYNRHKIPASPGQPVLVRFVTHQFINIIYIIH